MYDFIRSGRVEFHRSTANRYSLQLSHVCLVQGVLQRRRENTSCKTDRGGFRNQICTVDKLIGLEAPPTRCNDYILYTYPFH